MKKLLLLILLIITSFVLAQEQMMVRPKLLVQKPPQYPADAQKLRVEGTVLLNATVGTDGKVKMAEFESAEFIYSGGTKVVRSAGELESLPSPFKEAAESLIKSAKTSARIWKFTPAMLEGESIEATIRIPFNFDLRILPVKPGKNGPPKKK
ncbi:MAG: energy transducer TonB [Bacteroidota bacterium]